ncbi:MAG: ABC transporter ATP-binding protein [Planctomycetota bacterium]|nr:ABC transporter ATP-binding protein [Planctomycetota bacterium]MDA1250323.1 ABC transporter ATP-binding protein [Planctomycetota bacterium]
MELAAEIIDLHKYYFLGDNVVKALNGVSLEIPKGDFVAIMGSSGSGKSTLLNLLGALDRPTSGKYILGGHDVSQLDDDELSAIRNQMIGFIFQSYNLIAQYTVLENIEVPLYYGVRPMNAADRMKCRDLANEVGLGDRLDHRPFQLSGGQQQRVAIARALANDPEIILADEPTGNLDSTTEAEIMDTLRKLNEEGRTIIMVTHENEIARQAKRQIFMKDGVIAGTGIFPGPSAVAPVGGGVSNDDSESDEADEWVDLS